MSWSDSRGHRHQFSRRLDSKWDETLGSYGQPSAMEYDSDDIDEVFELQVVCILILEGVAVVVAKQNILLGSVHK